jgi:ribosome biogenesis GTPase
MNLSALGWDRWFEKHAAGMLMPGQSVARVMAVDRDAVVVRGEHGDMAAELSGKLRFSVQSAVDLPCVGDWVCVRRHASGGPALIQAVLPRKTFLRRKNPGKTMDGQMIAANIDVAFIVQACQYDLNIPRLDRYLVMADEGRIEPWIILSKTDLVTGDELERIMAKVRGAGISARIIPLSNATGVGVDALRALLMPALTYCLLGSSGVGKTSLINRLFGQDAFHTQAVSGTGEGVHTTARRHVIILDQGGLLIDTPGMRELGLLATDESVSDTFAGIHELALTCRFSNCSHTQEPGCAVMAAVQAGDLSEARYQSFIKLTKETRAHALSYAEKRKKDRTFGRFVKSAKKIIGKDT